MPKALAQFSIKRSGEDYLLTFEDEDGDKTVLSAEYDQLDLIGEAIEEQLEADDVPEADEEDDEEVEPEDD